MKTTGKDVEWRAEVLLVACVVVCLVSQAWAGEKTVSTNLPTQSIGLGQASWSGLSLQALNLQGTNATPRSGSLNALHTATATMLGPMASSQSLTNPPPAGLIVWWVFDEGSGTTVDDASGNGNSGTLQGDPPPTWANGVTSGALTFDGSQNYVQSDQAFNQTISAFTIEAWFAATSVSGENPAIVSTLGDDIGYNYLADIVIYTNSVFNGNSIGLNTRWDMLFAPLGLVDGNWHHVAGTWDGTNSSLYVDGQLVATQPDAYPAFTWTTPLRLAYRDTNGGCNYGGNIGEVRIYNRALSSDEVAADYNTDTVGDGIPDWWRLKYFGSGTTTDSVSCAACDPNGNGIPNSQEYTNNTNPLLPSGLTVPPNLIAWWTFDEGTGTLVGDVSGNGHCGALLGNPPPAWTNGVTSGALIFDGSQNYVQSELPFDETISAFTIEAWFAATSAYGENPAIISTLGDDIGFNYLADIVIYTNSFLHGNSIGLNTRWDMLFASMGLVDGNWHHVAGTWDGTNSSLYVDGQLVAIEADTYPAYAWQTPLRLAYRDTNGGCNYGGDIGEVRIYDQALSSNEVAAAYNTDTVGDGIPNWWRQKYFGNGSTTNSFSCASCTSTNPWAHGLTNLQLYQNPSVLISNNYTTFNDGIPDWWRVMYFGTATTTNTNSCASCDPTGDGFTNLQKYQNGLNPLVAYTISAPSMVISYSTGNSASVSNLGAGASYSWSVDNGTITSAVDTPTITWTAGNTGVATLNVTIQTTNSGGSPLPLNTTMLVTPCSLEASSITAPAVVYAGSLSNAASLPSPLTTSYNFTNGPPYGVIQGGGSDSNFYGVAEVLVRGTYFGDIFFNLNPQQGSRTDLHQFDVQHTSSGYACYPPVEGGGGDSNDFYGVTYFGGTNVNLGWCTGQSPMDGYGTVYKLNSQGSLTTLHVFGATPDGAYPIGSLVQGIGGDSNFYYGVTQTGGTNGCSLFWGCCLTGNGTVFRVSSTNGGLYTVLYSFAAGADGAVPYAGLALGTDGYLYGTTFLEGAGGNGTVFRVSTNGSSFTTLHAFSGQTDGITPLGVLVQGRGADSTNFYGTTWEGGTNGDGTVFQVNTNGTKFTTLYQFSGTDGARPTAGLAWGYDGYLYGTTSDGGSIGHGTIFRISSNGNFSTVYNFTGGADGGAPDDSEASGKGLSASVYDGYMYGTTATGGSDGYGTAYKFNTAMYTWSVTNGTIIAGQGTPNITWNAGTAGVAVVSVTISNTSPCSATISTNISILQAYYVDCVSGSDSNAGTSWASAWQHWHGDPNAGHVPQTTPLLPGDTVIISGGPSGGSQTYWFTNTTWQPDSGTNGAPVTYMVGQDAGHNGTVVFNGGNTNQNCAYGGPSFLTINGNYNGQNHMVFSNFTNLAINFTGSGCSNFALRYVTLYNATALISPIGCEYDHVVKHVAPNLQYETGAGGKSDAIFALLLSYPSYTGPMTGNTNFGASVFFHDMSVEIYWTGIVGSNGDVAIDSMDHVLVSNCTFQTVVNPTYQSAGGVKHPEAIQPGADAYGRVMDSTFINMAYCGVYGGPDTNAGLAMHDCQFLNNVFYNTNPVIINGSAAAGILLGCGGGPQLNHMYNILVANNTFADVDYGFQIGPYDTSQTVYTNITAVNNIGVNNKAACIAGNLSGGTPIANMTNYCNKAIGEMISPANFVAPTTTYAVKFVSYTPYATNNDFHYATNDTGAIGNGTNWSAYFGANKDGLTNGRPAVGAWNIGAY